PEMSTIPPSPLYLTKIVSFFAFYVLERGFAIAYGGDDSPTSLNSTLIVLMLVRLTAYQIPTQILKSNNSQTLIQTSTSRELICNPPSKTTGPTAANDLEKDMSTGTLQMFNIKDTTNLSKKSIDKISQDLIHY
ncbi:36015_t:CDS:2, partial [Racocetra persica]